MTKKMQTGSKFARQVGPAKYTNASNPNPESTSRFVKEAGISQRDRGDFTMIVDADARQIAGTDNPCQESHSACDNEDEIIRRAAGLRSDYPRVAIGLVTQYANAPQTLTAEEKQRVEVWIEQLPHLRPQIEKLRKYAKYFNGSPSLSDY
jgi:hypothetical protein